MGLYWYRPRVRLPALSSDFHFKWQYSCTLAYIGSLHCTQLGPHLQLFACFIMLIGHCNKHHTRSCIYKPGDVGVAWVWLTALVTVDFCDICHKVTGMQHSSVVTGHWRGCTVTDSFWMVTGCDPSRSSKYSVYWSAHLLCL